MYLIRRQSLLININKKFWILNCELLLVWDNNEQTRIFFLVIKFNEKKICQVFFRFRYFVMIVVNLFCISNIICSNENSKIVFNFKDIISYVIKITF